MELESISQGTGELLETFNSAEQKSIKNKFSPGTVLFGKLRPYLRKFYLPYFEGVCSSEIWVMRSNKIEPAFLYSFIQTPYFISLANQSSGSKMPRADWGLIETSKIAYPPNSAERVKIGKFLKLIDERIATQNKIIAHLESLIKGLSDTLLENPLWQKTYLRSFMQFYSTNSLSWGQLSYEEGEIRNLHYGLIHSFQTSEIDTDSLPRILPANVPKQYTLCQAGDVAFADASEDTDEIGKAVEFIRTHKASVICGLHTIHGRDIKCKTLLGFKRVAFNSHYFHDQIKRLAQGTKVFSITSSNLSSCYIYIPDIVMQKSIVVLFEAYEEQLITNKRLLEQYEKQKRYLLQQMFI
ncbi:restriction endonuclease subunit S [Bacteroides fragilis]|uniref:restriction endonuclease subunit S n=1 Tax=Bacteroides fragilis TaxID=817 RepID=UPI0013047A4B|nr:restriction endonuclease subunit S [Bacteroides fragilis]MCZ2510596.1 restriction endonuclease subunit S [Bacteroides fragilis]